ncbi:MAG: hypothetical protein JNK05_19625 [Myxococcales bacterium]|nr:hypothetical protein [Myxococcales bacterium]
MATELTVADAIESGSNMIRVLREELAANDTAETAWTPGAKLASSEAAVERALSISIAPAPVNDDGFVADFDLARDEDADAILAADGEFAMVCDERRDAWLARVENEDECD